MGMEKKSRSPVTSCVKTDKITSLVSYDSSSASDSESLQDFDFLDSEDESLDEGKRLTKLVRKSYTSHLERSLEENYKKWLEKTNCLDQKVTHSQMTMIATLAERKALRACMMRNAYQKTMVAMMKDIRRSTAIGQLYKDIRKRRSVKNKYLEKGTQTEAIVENMEGLQNSKSSICKVSVPNPSRVFTLKNDAIINNISPPKGKNTFFPSNILDPNKEMGFKNHGMESSSVSLPPFTYNFSPTKDSVGREKRKASDDEKKCTQKVYKKNPCVSPKKSTITSKQKDDLEERLAQLSSLFGDSEVSQECEPIEEHEEMPKSTPHKSRSPTINWHIEVVAQMCNMNRILLRMSTERRIRMEKRFKDLFGGETEPVKQITHSEITYCRRRIADMVVSELTQYYVACRIGSKLIFKELAKYITNSILKSTYAPDAERVKKEVDDIFLCGKSVVSLDDLFL